MAEVLAIKIGNSRISCGEFEDNNLLGLKHHSLKDQELAVKEILTKAKQAPEYLIAICSVVPSISQSLIDTLKANNIRHFDINVESQNIIQGAYETLGADRLANIIAALKLYTKKDPVFVLDFGSSTTLTAVDKNGKFLGGLISLGLGKTFETLHQSCEQLPDIEPDANEYLNPLADKTDDAIVSGNYLAHLGLIDRWVTAGRQKLKSKSTIIATGGYSQLLAPHTEIFDHVDPDLTLKGISLVAEMAGLKDPY